MQGCARWSPRSRASAEEDGKLSHQSKGQVLSPVIERHVHWPAGEKHRPRPIGPYLSSRVATVLRADTFILCCIALACGSLVCAMLSFRLLQGSWGSTAAPAHSKPPLLRQLAALRLHDASKNGQPDHRFVEALGRCSPHYLHNPRRQRSELCLALCTSAADC